MVHVTQDFHISPISSLNFLIARAVKHWNHLPREMTVAPLLSMFKWCLDNALTCFLLETIPLSFVLDYFTGKIVLKILGWLESLNQLALYSSWTPVTGKK